MNLTETFAARAAASDERVALAVLAFREYARLHDKSTYASKREPNVIVSSKVETAFRASCILNGFRLSDSEMKRAVSAAWRAIRDDKFVV